MMRSLTSRLVLATIALVAIVALAIGTATTIAMKTYLTDRLDREIGTTAPFVTGPGPGPIGGVEHNDGLGKGLGSVQAYFSTDGSDLKRGFGGPPAVVLGPGEPLLAHQTDEWCSIARVEQSVELFGALMRRWCGA